MNSTLSSYLYKFLERILTHATTFIVSIVLARLLTPADYGALAILLVFVTLAQVFIEGGLSSALIQKQDVKEKDYNIVLSITILLALFLYLVIFIVSDKLEFWLDMEGLSSAFKIIGLVLFPSAYLSVIKAKLVRHMRFKEQMYITFACSLISGCLGVSLAYCGMGVWALIFQQLSNTILLVILFICITKWLPRIIFYIDVNRAKSLYDYGYKIMLTNLLVRSNNEIVSLAIGTQFSKEALGLYDRGKQFPQAAVENIEGTVASVLFPILSRCQQNTYLVKQKTREMQVIGAFVNFFILSIIAGAAPTYIPLLLTEKWVGCIPLLILWTLCYMPSIYTVISTTAINSVGNSNMTLKRQLLTTLPALISILIVVFLSTDVISVMILKVFFIPYSFYITARYLSKSVGYTIIEQIQDQLPYFFIGGIVFCVVYLENHIFIGNFTILCIQIISAIFVYLLFSKIFRLKGYTQMLSIILKVKNS